MQNGVPVQSAARSGPRDIRASRRRYRPAILKREFCGRIVILPQIRFSISAFSCERESKMVAVTDRVISGPRAVLKPYETRRLLALPDKRTAKGRRAAALLALMACGGLRGIEAAAVRVSGIEPYKGGSIAVTFRCAKRKAEE